jgi:phage terminase large subunit-like protein
MWAWTERLELYELTKKIEETCKKFKVDRVLVEDKASGYPVAQELRRRGRTIADKLAQNPKTLDRADFGVQLVPPEGDHIARLIAVQNLFECGLIYAEMPKGAHDDLADATSQGLSHLRAQGLAQLPDEDELDRIDENKYRSPLTPLYPAAAGGLTIPYQGRDSISR